MALNNVILATADPIGWKLTDVNALNRLKSCRFDF